MFPRSIDLPRTRSFFLFGARGTGKSTLIHQRFAPETTWFVDLLSASQEDAYSRDPDLFYRQVRQLPSAIQTVVVDEVQKVPKLLDSVHRLLFDTPIQFVLTGSSARKLRRGAANMLAGRAFERSLHPLTSIELGERFELDRVLSWGSLPEVFSLDAADRREYLEVYARTYLKEEIWAEHLIRQLEPFRKFLEVAAQQAGQPVNYARIGRDVGVDGKTVKEYLQILEDTLVGFLLEPFLGSTRQRVQRAPKFYFFDLGVSRALSHQLHALPIESTSYFGELFEQFVVLELIRQEAYQRRGHRFSYLADQTAEVDLVIERPGKPPALVEIKSTCEVRPDRLRSLRSLGHSLEGCELYCLSRDPRPQRIGSIQALPWQQGLSEI
jgi:predicted AAA+ superfamily ATPase